MKQITNEFYTINNGCKQKTGVGFKCLHCNTENNFVDPYEEMYCEYCRKLNRFSREETEKYY